MWLNTLSSILWWHFWTLSVKISGVSFVFLCFSFAFPPFSEAFKTLVPLLGCAVKIAKHASFVFRHPKNTISQSPFGILHIVCSSGKDLNRKLLLLCRLPVCLPVSSMLKLRLPQFLFYRAAPFFPEVLGFNQIVVIHSLCFGTCSCTFNDALLKKGRLFGKPFMKAWT